jgi:hypothetical protein
MMITSPSPADLGVVPGDWFVVNPHERLFWWIEMGESLIDGRHTTWGHAGVASRWDGNTLMIVEAEPGGAVERSWHWQDNPHLWSTGMGLSVSGMSNAALHYAGYDPTGLGGRWTKDRPGVGYSFADYAAIEAHSLHLPLPGVRHRIETSGHMICSQLVDKCAQDAGVQLFDDKRWNGFVKPSDLGYLLEEHHAR